jgi:putative DNA primase/helicase
LLIGPTRSGKGTIARVLADLLGKGNVAGPTLASLGTNFGLAPLIGKPLAVVSDARLAGSNVHQVVERLLSISGEDRLTIDRKYREPWSGKLPARFVILSNELPRFGDASGAIANRFVVLAMHESFLGRENTSLIQELTAELPGILLWALDGLDRLTRQGRFTEPKSSADSIVALQDLVSPVAAYVRDNCDVGVGHEILIDYLFADWSTWCEGNGHKRGSVQTFGRDLRAVIPHLRVARPRVGDAKRERRFQGVQLKDKVIRHAAEAPPDLSVTSLTTSQPRLDAPETVTDTPPDVTASNISVTDTHGGVYDFAEAMSDTPTCWRCGEDLVWPDDQHRGTCWRCRPTTDDLFAEEATS